VEDHAIGTIVEADVVPGISRGEKEQVEKVGPNGEEYRAVAEGDLGRSGKKLEQKETGKNGNREATKERYR
jgi:hypothetical protein